MKHHSGAANRVLMAALAAIAVVTILVLEAPSAFADAGFTSRAAHAATTGTYNYDATAEAIKPCIAVTAAADHLADTTLVPSAVDPNHTYDDLEQLAGTSTRPGGGFLAPQTTDPECGRLTWVIGESTQRTKPAAAAFRAKVWDGPGPTANHLQTCSANEAWLRSVIAADDKIIDIGIDKGRKETRSPYYELERRIIAETGYPVEQRFWWSSPPYVDPSYGGPCP